MNRKPRLESTSSVSDRVQEPSSPTHVTLAVVLQVRDGRLEVLLWRRAKEPCLGAWALPGGYLAPGETLEASIRRHLAVKVDVRDLSHLEQLETLSDPDRQPGEWQLATAYLGLVPSDVDPALPEDTIWHPIDELPELAFDHEEIVLAGRDRLRAKLSYTNVGFAPRRGPSRSPSCATSTSPRSATRSLRRTSSGCSSAGASSSRRASAAARAGPADGPPRCSASGSASSK